MARISRKTEVPSTLPLRVEVKEPTDDVKHSGSDHRQGISAPIFGTLTLLRERNKLSGSTVWHVVCTIITKTGFNYLKPVLTI